MQSFVHWKEFIFKQASELQPAKKKTTKKQNPKELLLFIVQE